MNKSASLSERITHAVGYEIFAVMMFAPIMAWIFKKPLEATGALAVVMSLIAMLWNMIYNAAVDKLIKKPRIKWRFLDRLVHGLGFEGGIIILCLPVAAWMLSISLLQAFLIELSFFAFILPYTIIYNWSFDKIKDRMNRRRESRNNMTSHTLD